ncbi:hypothetical protein FKO01_15860 [Mesorhizobium sp. B2-3-3]|nr:hypothetical protein FKO01_15860 [Mesorhizobium sp. B2-3-3]
MAGGDGVALEALGTEFVTPRGLSLGAMGVTWAAGFCTLRTNTKRITEGGRPIHLTILKIERTGRTRIVALEPADAA